MATATQQPPITICPPGPRRPELEWKQRIQVQRAPVSTTFIADGETESTGLSFGDYERMYTFEHKLDSGRDLECPTWARDDGQLRTVLAKAMEVRAGFRHAQPGIDEVRIKRAQRAVVAGLPRRIEILGGLCKEYVELKRAAGSAARRRDLEIQIEALDTYIRTSQKDGGLALLAGCVQCFWREGLNSVECAERLHIKPPHVRQVLFCLRDAAETCGFETKRRTRNRQGRPKGRPKGSVRFPCKTLPVPAGVVPPDERYLSYVKFCKGMGTEPRTEDQWRMGGAPSFDKGIRNKPHWTRMS